MHEILRRNLGYKIISIILALLFWLWVTNQGSSQVLTGDQPYTVPLVTKNQPLNLVVMSKLPAVRVRLQGSNPSYNVKDLFSYIDLSGGTPGTHNFTVHLDPPPGIKVIDIQPSTVALQIDTVQEKVLPVQANIQGSPSEGYIAGNPVLRPLAVNVRGPGSVLSKLDKVVVEVSVAGASESVEVSRPVLFRDKDGKPIYGPDPAVDILTASPQSVDVIIPIQAKALSSKMVPVKVLSKGTPAKGMMLRSLVSVPASVKVLGKPEVLKGFDSLAIGPLDLTDLAEDKVYQISPDRVTLPSGISFAAGTTLTVVAQIGPGPVEKTFKAVPVVIKNIPEGLKADSISPINIILSGMPETFNSMTPDQIKLWVDAAGLNEGNYPDTDIFWQLPPGIEMVSDPKTDLTLKSSKPGTGDMGGTGDTGGT